jgi:hypothetical protein
MAYPRPKLVFVIKNLNATNRAGGFVYLSTEYCRTIRHHNVDRCENIAISDAPVSIIPDRYTNRCNTFRVNWFSAIRKAKFLIKVCPLNLGLQWMNTKCKSRRTFDRSKRQPGSATQYPALIRSPARAVLFCIDARDYPNIACHAKFFAPAGRHGYIAPLGP